MTVIGSHLCTDTIYAICKLKEKNIDFDFKNISSDFQALKDFMKVREEAACYEEVRKNGGLGIPCFITEEKVTLDIKEVL